MTPSAMPASVAPQKPSKGPPPLPATAAAAPSHGTAVEAMFFVEGIDGRAESLPSAEHYAPAVDEHPSPDTDGAPVSHDEEWFEAKEEKEEVEFEDPAQTRRRKAARVGVAWGAIALVALAAVAAFIRPRAIEPSATASTRPSFVETVARSPVAAPIVATRTAAPAPPAAVPPSRPPVRAMTASVAAAAPASARGVVRKGASSSPAKRAASSSPKDSGAQHARTPSAPRASSNRKRP
jgi:hypothetical protein